MTERSAPVPSVKTGSRKTISSQSGGQQGRTPPRRRRAPQRPWTLAEWGLSSLGDGDQRGPWIFDRIVSMTDPRDLKELWRTIAAVLSGDEPMSWPFTEGEPPIEEAQQAVYLLAGFALTHQGDGAPDFEPLVLINDLRQRHELRQARDDKRTVQANRRRGGASRQGGAAGAKWREQRDPMVRDADQVERERNPNWNEKQRFERIKNWLAHAIAIGRIEPPPKGVSPELTFATFHAIIATKPH